MSTFNLSTRYLKSHKAKLSHLRYADGNPCLRILGADTGEVLMTATVNVEGWRPFNKNQVLIKNWSENEGLLDCLEEQGILKRTGIEIPTGFVKAIECELSPEWME
jgi:hypothetical protein